jgi:UDP-N-acetyl-D-mannosaminuronic acid dehydrogenase
VNEAKPLHVVEQVRRAVQRVGRTPRIACFGLSYKANTDDFRESPALHIAETLAAEYPQRVVAVEPFVDALRERRRSDLEFPVVSAEAALSQCDVAVILVGHRQFAEMRRPVGCEIVDAIGLWRTEANP